MSYYYGISSDSVSSLFSSLSGNSSNSGNLSVSNDASMISQYSSIRNGSYMKLLSAYYKKYGNTVSETSSNSTSSDTTKTLSEVKTISTALKDSTNKLLDKGSDSIFAKVTTKDSNGVSTTGYDMDAIYKGVAQFVSDYNKTIEAMDDVNSTSILNSAKSMVNTTKSNSSVLTKLGITINSDNTLNLDEATFKKADVSTIKSMFNTTGSYGYSIATQASKMNYNATQEATKSNTYSSSGNYSSTYSMGNLYDSLY